MVYLHMDASTFCIKSKPTVKAPYNTVEEADAQAQQNIKNRTQRPISIEDELGNILKLY